MKNSDSNSIAVRRNAVKLAAVDIAECGLFVALMVAGAYIKISVYALMGVVGIPVFSAEPFGGFAYVLKLSFGYILGFIASAGVAGIAYGKAKKLWQTVLISLAAFLADYLVGIPYFIAVWQINAYGGLWQAVVTYNLIYMPKDAVLCVMAAFIAYAVTPAIKRMRGKNKKTLPQTGEEQPSEAEQSRQD